MTPEEQLEEFLFEYLPKTQDLTRQLHRRMRDIWPGAVEFVYDNYNFLVIGFGPTQKPSSAVLSLAVSPLWVSICFLDGVKLSDPHHILKGEGNKVRSIRILSPEEFENPHLQDILQLALAHAKISPDPNSKSELIIRSISPKKRPRRPR